MRFIINTKISFPFLFVVITIVTKISLSLLLVGIIILNKRSYPLILISFMILAVLPTQFRTEMSSFPDFQIHFRIFFCSMFSASICGRRIQVSR